MNRIAGIETEYGCLAPESYGLPAVPTRVRDHLFKKKKYGLIDLHDRDYDEPAGNGGFLFNGGRLYLDMGHIEYCTPECTNLADLVAYEQAGDTLLQTGLQELGLDNDVFFIKNNIDHYTSATFGCHENYSLRRDAPLAQKNVDSLLAFLAMRIVLFGSGRVGMTLAPRRYHRNDSNEPVLYQISQRADFIQTDIYEWVQFNRALINARDEPLADYRRFRRLHLLLGDSNILPFTKALKVGSTSLMLDLLEANALPKFSLANPVIAMRQVSHHPDGDWKVKLHDGREWSALDVLEEFWRAASSGAIELDADGKWTLTQWAECLEALRKNRDPLIGKLDWITKRFLLDSFVQSEKIDWSDPWLESLDLEYHQINPKRCLANGIPGVSIDKLGLPNFTKRDYLIQPTDNTRARLRSEAMRMIVQKKLPYVIDWDLIYIGEGRQIQLEDPYSNDLSTLKDLAHFNPQT
jgi:proteasome accessory factor A